ncbi:MAG: response regulator [bacterium]|nr:response regulator [bacterium]
MKKILVVDDNWSIRDSLIQGLKHRGFDVEAANNVQNALLKLNQSSFDVLVSDLKMPGANGFILATIVRQLYPKIRIILMSGYDYSEFAAVDYHAELTRYPKIKKPIKMMQLEKLLQAVTV